MGCDIHLIVERRKKSGKWVAVAIADYPYLGDFKSSNPYPAAKFRNYLRFAKLAGVRGEGPEPKGFPKDASQTAKYFYKRYQTDHHSASWNELPEATAIFVETEWQALNPDSYAAKYPMSFYFGVDSDEAEKAEHRIVFWFDN